MVDTHLYLHQIQSHWAQARDFAQRYLKSHPEDDFKEWLALLDFLENGDKTQLIAALNQIAYDPNEFRGRLSKALISREYNEALVLLRGMDEIGNPRFANLQMEADSNLVAALIHLQLGNLSQSRIEADKARAHWEDILAGSASVSGDPNHLTNLMLSYALLGSRGKAEELIPRVRELLSIPYWNYVGSQFCEITIAIAHLVLGDDDKALSTLEAASEMDGPIFLNRELDLWFIFDRLRGNPRFDTLLED